MFDPDELRLIRKALVLARERERQRWRYYSVGAGAEQRGASVDAEHSLEKMSHIDEVRKKVKTILASLAKDEPA